MMHVQIFVNNRDLINVKCSSARVTTNDKSMWQGYVSCITNKVANESKIRHKEYKCKIPAKVQAVAGFLTAACYALEQAEEFERMNQG